jgi:hypothetical protein
MTHLQIAILTCDNVTRLAGLSNPPEITRLYEK